jgi:FMN-dependent NADH-azoreductase
MKNILLVLSSPRGAQSYSHRFAHQVVEDLVKRHPGAPVVVRDLAQAPLPHIGEDFVAGIYTPADGRTAAQAKEIARSDALVDELLAADVLVVAVPMHNFGPPSTLKAWIDHVARAGRTFAYTDKGPRGLLKDKSAILVLSRGGVYSDGPMKAFEFQESYLRGVLGFLGISDVQAVRVEGVSMGDEALQKSLLAARAQAGEVARAIL